MITKAKIENGRVKIYLFCENESEEKEINEILQSKYPNFFIFSDRTDKNKALFQIEVEPSQEPI